MRSWRLASIVFLTASGLGCDTHSVIVPDGALPPPASLGYELEPSGDPARPAGILLAWSDVASPALASYRVYSRGDVGSPYGLRGETTSNTFHDNGVPHLQYYVTAVDASGFESVPSPAVTVDERLQLERPASLATVSLNGAIHLWWTDNAYAADPGRFKWYRVYSSSYDLDVGLCLDDWALEGTTVAPEFLASALPNGRPRCFGVSAVSVEGYESLWSPLREDTPRPDARNVLLTPFDGDRLQSGFRFWDDGNRDGVAQASELGLVIDGNRSDADFWIYRDPADSTLWIVPEFAGTSMQLYGTTPLEDLTSIDYAPAGGYTRNMFQAVPGYGYVFRIQDGTTLHYGALRVTHVGRNYLILDWSFQADPGNPELVRHAGLSVSLESGEPVGGR